MAHNTIPPVDTLVKRAPNIFGIEKLHVEFVLPGELPRHVRLDPGAWEAVPRLDEQVGQQVEVSEGHVSAGVWLVTNFKHFQVKIDII